MSKKKYLIDKKVILDCEKMTLSCDRESLRISESECNLLIDLRAHLGKSPHRILKSTVILCNTVKGISVIGSQFRKIIWLTVVVYINHYQQE